MDGAAPRIDGRAGSDVAAPHRPKRWAVRGSCATHGLRIAGAATREERAAPGPIFKMSR